MTDRMYYLIYETTNKITGKVYRGMHRTNNPDDYYLGSGVALGLAVKKYGASAFDRRILCCALSFEDMVCLEREFVDEHWVNREDTYNLILGGIISGDTKKWRETSMSKFGFDHPMKSERIKQKMFSTNLQRYGQRSTASLSWVREKAKLTCQSRYGVSYVTQTEEFKEKAISTWQKNYGEGITNPFQAQEIKDKIKETLLDKYGVDHISKSDEFKQASEKTCLKKYGVRRYQNTDEFKKLVTDSSSVYKITLTNPIGEQFETTNLQQFCIDNSLSYSAFNNQFFSKRGNSITVPQHRLGASEVRQNTTGWTATRERRYE